MLMSTHTKVCLAYVNVLLQQLHCRGVCMYIHGDNWLEPCRAVGIVMTSACPARSGAIGSSITWNGTCLLVLS